MLYFRLMCEEDVKGVYISYSQVKIDDNNKVNKVTDFIFFIIYNKIIFGNKTTYENKALAIKNIYIIYKYLE